MIYIYTATNLKTNKVYVGVTKRSLEKRIQFHYLYAYRRASPSCKFASALREFGSFDWRWEIIDQVDDLNKAHQLEIFYINKYNSYNDGYNSTIGGIGSYGRVLSEETKQRISKSNTGKIITEEARKNLSDSLKGRRLTEQDKESKSKAARNRTYQSASGHKGVQPIKKKGEIVGWKADFCINRRNVVNLGNFLTIEEAIARRVLAVKEFEETGTVLKP